MASQRRTPWSLYKSAAVGMTRGDRLILLLIAVDSVVGPLVGIPLLVFGSGATRVVGVVLLVITISVSAVISPMFRVRAQNRYRRTGASSTSPDPQRPS